MISLVRLCHGAIPLLSFFIFVACNALPTGIIGSDAILVESFDPGQTSSWYLENDGFGENRIEDGRLFIRIDRPQTVQYATLRSNDFADLALAVDATQVSGSLNSSYGILFRLDPELGFYRFEITSNGNFVVEKRNVATESWTRLSNDWVESPAILQGLGQINRLGVVANDRRLSFSINGFEVLSVQDEAFTTGKVALSAGTFSQVDLEVAFDNLTISNP